jgi:type VI secretion system protein ImpF
MANLEFDRTVQQSVLDRLTDREPRITADPPTTYRESKERYRDAVRRDLEWLLNTRRIPEEAPPGCDELRRSLYYYGLPDVTSMSRDSLDEQRRLLRLVQEAITAFEPRLADVRVSLVDSDERPTRRLHFIVEALLRMDPTPEPIVFDTALDISSGAYEVQGADGA